VVFTTKKQKQLSLAAGACEWRVRFPRAFAIHVLCDPLLPNAHAWSKTHDTFVVGLSVGGVFMLWLWTMMAWAADTVDLAHGAFDGKGETSACVTLATEAFDFSHLEFWVET